MSTLRRQARRTPVGGNRRRALTQLIERDRQIVMRRRILGIEFDGALETASCHLELALYVQHIAQVAVIEKALAITIDGLLHQLACLLLLPQTVRQHAQQMQRLGMARIFGQ